MELYKKYPVNIPATIHKISQDIRDYMDNYNLNVLIAISLLNGALQFTIDLLKHFNRFETNFKYSHYFFPLIVSSYISDGIKDELQIKYFDEDKFKKILEKHRGKCLVLIIDDIIDTGETIMKIEKYIKDLAGYYRHIKTCSFIVNEKTMILPYFIGFFDNEDNWFVGYGMDTNGYDRFTNHLYIKENIK